MKNFKLKLLFALLLAFPLLAQAQSILETKVDLDYQTASIEQVITDLEAKYSVRFFFPNDLSLNENITIPAGENSLDDILFEVTRATGFAYEGYGNDAVILAPARLLNKEYDKDFYQQRLAQKEQLAQSIADELPVVTLGDANTASSAVTVRLNGFVNDDNSGETIIGATILIEGTGDGTITDETGQYEWNIPVGEHRIVIQSIGYNDKNLILQIYENSSYDFKIGKEAVTLGEVVVTDRAADQNVKSTVMGVEKLDAKALKKLPAFLGEVDIIKSLQLLPGVSTVGEAAGGFNVRGGTVDQNLTLQDGMLFFNTAHALGLFSLMNPDFVKNVELFKGSMPAKYGGRLSSVLDVELKDGNYQKLVGKGGIGLVSSRLTLESPIVKGKSSVIIGGRISYADWIFGLVRSPEVRNSNASFYDGNAKISQRLGKKGKISGTFYTSKDRFKYSDRSDFSWGTTGGTLAFNYLLKENFSFGLEGVFSDYKSGLSDPDGNDAFTLDNGIRYYGVRPDFMINLPKHAINFGAQWKKYEVSRGDLRPASDISSIIEKIIPTEFGQEVGVYVQDDFKISDKLSVSAGLRYSYYQNLGAAQVFTYSEDGLPTEETVTGMETYGDGEVIASYGGLEPRVSLNFGLTETSSFKMSFNRTQQFINQISNTTAVSPIDIWQVSNLHIEPTYANNYSIGFFKNLAENNWQTSIEFFYRDIDNLIEYKDGADLLVNETLEREILPADGRAYGAEFSIKKSVGRWNGWFGYTYSRSERQVAGDIPENTINEGEWFPSNYDRPHDMSAVFSYQVSKRSNIAINFVYSTGRPTSAPVGKYGVENIQNVADYSFRNQYRIPDYHRMDFSYTIDTNHKKDKRWEGSWTFSLYNVYGRRNAFSVFFSQQSNQPPQANRLSILGSPLPALTYNFKFL